MATPPKRRWGVVGKNKDRGIPAKGCKKSVGILGTQEKKWGPAEKTKNTGGYGSKQEEKSQGHWENNG